jgi:hypothetical protein
MYGEPREGRHIIRSPLSNQGALYVPILPQRLQAGPQPCLLVLVIVKRPIPRPGLRAKLRRNLLFRRPRMGERFVDARLQRCGSGVSVSGPVPDKYPPPARPSKS